MTSEEALAQHAAFLVGADAARAQGDLTGALTRYRAAGEVVAAIAGDGAARHVLDGLAMAQQRIGEVLVAQGDLAAALEAMRAELAVRRRIAEAQPGDAARRDDVARAAARVAEVLVLRSALATFQGGGQAAGQVGGLTRRRPGEASWTMSAVAGALEAQGNLGGALALYREGLAIRRRLVAQDPDNVAWALDVTWSLTGLGGALMARGDLDGALASLGEALAIRRGLAARDPDNGQRRLDVSWSLMAVGDALADKGDHAGSLAALREALAVRRVLLAADPENDGLRCDASVSLTRIGDVQAASGDLDGAAAAFHEARAIVEQLITRAPERAEWREDLIAIDECIAELARAA